MATPHLSTPDSRVKLTARVAPPVQVHAGPGYRCFLCGVPAQGLRWWPTGGRGASALDVYAAHIAYMVPGCRCHLAHVGCTRVAVLDGTITALHLANSDEIPDAQARERYNVATIESALVMLAAVSANDGRA